MEHQTFHAARNIAESFVNAVKTIYNGIFCDDSHLKSTLERKRKESVCSNSSRLPKRMFLNIEKENTSYISPKVYHNLNCPQFHLVKSEYDTSMLNVCLSREQEHSLNDCDIPDRISRIVNSIKKRAQQRPMGSEIRTPNPIFEKGVVKNVINYSPSQTVQQAMEEINTKDCSSFNADDLTVAKNNMFHDCFPDYTVEQKNAKRNISKRSFSCSTDNQTVEESNISIKRFSDCAVEQKVGKTKILKCGFYGSNMDQKFDQLNILKKSCPPSIDDQNDEREKVPEGSFPGFSVDQKVEKCNISKESFSKCVEEQNVSKGNIPKETFPGCADEQKAAKRKKQKKYSPQNESDTRPLILNRPIRFRTLRKVPATTQVVNPRKKPNLRRCSSNSLLDIKSPDSIHIDELENHLTSPKGTLTELNPTRSKKIDNIPPHVLESRSTPQNESENWLNPTQLKRIDNIPQHVLESYSSPQNKFGNELNPTQSKLIDNIPSHVLKSHSNPQNESENKLNPTQSNLSDNIPQNILESHSTPQNDSGNELNPTQSKLIDNIPQHVLQNNSTLQNKSGNDLNLTQSKLIDNIPPHVLDTHSNPQNESGSEMNPTQSKLIFNIPQHVLESHSTPQNESANELSMNENGIPQQDLEREFERLCVLSQRNLFQSEMVGKNQSSDKKFRKKFATLWTSISPDSEVFQRSVSPVPDGVRRVFEVLTPFTR